MRSFDTEELDRIIEMAWEDLADLLRGATSRATTARSSFLSPS